MISEYRNANVEITGSVDHPAWVVLTDNWHSSWKATVNGHPTEIVRVNGTFRGVHVGSGNFRIEMSYEPGSLRAGIAVTLLATLVVLVLVLTPSRRELTGRSVGATRSSAMLESAVGHNDLHHGGTR